MNIKHSIRTAVDHFAIPVALFVGLMFFPGAEAWAAICLVAFHHIFVAIMAYVATRLLMAVMRSMGAKDITRHVSFMTCLRQPYVFLFAAMTLVPYSEITSAKPAH